MAKKGGRSLWNDDEEKFLISCYEIRKQQFDIARNKTKVWDEVVEEFTAKNYSRNSKQLSDKWNIVKSSYNVSKTLFVLKNGSKMRWLIGRSYSPWSKRNGWWRPIKVPSF